MLFGADRATIASRPGVRRCAARAVAGTPQPRDGDLQIAGGSPSVAARWNAEINKILALPDVKEQYAKMGLVPGGGTPAELDAFIRADIAKWAKVIRTANIKAD